MQKVTADYVQRMPATIQSSFICLHICYYETWKL